MSEEKKYPSKIKCTRCNNRYGVRPDVYLARIKKFGSEEELLANYTCRRCQKAQGVDSRGAEREDAPQRATPYNRQQQRRYQMQKYMHTDPFDNIKKPFWLHKSFLDKFEGRYFERMYKEIIELEEKGHLRDLNRRRSFDLSQVTNVCYNPPFAIAHHDRCKEGKEKCFLYEKCGLRMRGGLHSARDCTVECSECGQWVDPSAEICEGCGAPFE